MSKDLTKRRLSAMVIIVLAVVFSASCKKNANTGNTTTANGGGGGVFGGAPTGGGTTGGGTTTTPGGTTGGGMTAAGPMDTLKAYHEAAMRRDVMAVKRYLSSGTTRMLEDAARQGGKTLDEALRESAANSPEMTEMPQFSNERVTGDTATVDVRAKGQMIAMPMVKEGGEWKIAMDRMLGGMQRPGPGQNQPQSGDDGDDHNGHD